MVSIMLLLTENGSFQLHMLRSKSIIIIPQSIKKTTQIDKPMICQTE